MSTELLERLDSDLNSLRFYQPYYVSPFPNALNKNYSHWLENYCSEWSVANGGVLADDADYQRAITHSDVGLFSAVCFPNASRHRLEKLVKWGQMLFISDDYHTLLKNSGYPDVDGEFWNDLLESMNRLMSGIKVPCAKWSNFTRGIHECVREMHFDFVPHQRKRCANMISNYIRGSLEESKWSSNKVPTWEEYHQVRVGTVGGDMCFQLIEYSQEVTLTDAEFYHAKMTDLLLTVSEQIFLVNDLLTFRKEVAECDFRFSTMKHSFTVLVAEGKTLQQAVNTVHSKIVECDKKIEAQIERILRDPTLIYDQCSKDRFTRFLEGVRLFIGGYWRHAVCARRYHGVNFTGALPPEGEFVYSRTETVVTPTRHHEPYTWTMDVIPQK